MLFPFRGYECFFCPKGGHVGKSNGLKRKWYIQPPNSIRNKVMLMYHINIIKQQNIVKQRLKSGRSYFITARIRPEFSIKNNQVRGDMNVLKFHYEYMWCSTSIGGISVLYIYSSKCNQDFGNCV